MFKKCIWYFIFLITVLTYCSAIDLNDPLSILSSNSADLFTVEYVPQEIFPHRGVEADEDSVVFYYDNGFYLFLYKNRVWQVRFDQTYRDEFMKFKIGMLRSDVLSITQADGQIPISSGDDFVTFQLKESPYPIRMKLYFVADILDDFYIYRADF